MKFSVSKIAMAPAAVSILFASGCVSDRNFDDRESGVVEITTQYVSDRVNGRKISVDVRVSKVPDTDNNSDYYISYIEGSEFCGNGGCVLLLVKSSGEKLSIESSTTLVRLPISMEDRGQGVLPALSVGVSGGGTQFGPYAALPFDGHGYASNPTVPPAVRLEEKFPHDLIREDHAGISVTTRAR